LVPMIDSSHADFIPPPPQQPETKNAHPPVVSLFSLGVLHYLIGSSTRRGGGGGGVDEQQQKIKALVGRGTRREEKFFSIFLVALGSFSLSSL